MSLEERHLGRRIASPFGPVAVDVDAGLVVVNRIRRLHLELSLKLGCASPHNEKEIQKNHPFPSDSVQAEMMMGHVTHMTALDNKGSPFRVVLGRSFTPTLELLNPVHYIQ